METASLPGLIDRNPTTNEMENIMYTAVVKLFDRSKSEVVFTQVFIKTFKTTKAADKFLYEYASSVSLPNRDLWLVGGVLKDGKFEYNIGLL